MSPASVSSTELLPVRRRVKFQFTSKAVASQWEENGDSLPDWRRYLSRLSSDPEACRVPVFVLRWRWLLLFEWLQETKLGSICQPSNISKNKLWERQRKQTCKSVCRCVSLEFSVFTPPLLHESRKLLWTELKSLLLFLQDVLLYWLLKESVTQRERLETLTDVHPSFFCRARS